MGGTVDAPGEPDVDVSEDQFVTAQMDETTRQPALCPSLFPIGDLLEPALDAGNDLADYLAEISRRAVVSRLAARVAGSTAIASTSSSCDADGGFLRRKIAALPAGGPLFPRGEAFCAHLQIGWWRQKAPFPRSICSQLGYAVDLLDVG